MKRNTDWTDVMRDTLRDAELTPPEGGWERLRRDLDRMEPVVPEPRKNVWRIDGPRIAAAAAAVLICVVAGELLLRPDKELEMDGNVVAEAVEQRESAVAIPRVPDSDPLREKLAETTGWIPEPVVAAPSSVSGSVANASVVSAAASEQSQLLAVSTTGVPKVRTAVGTRADGTDGVDRTDGRSRDVREEEAARTDGRDRDARVDGTDGTDGVDGTDRTDRDAVGTEIRLGGTPDSERADRRNLSGTRTEETADRTRRTDLRSTDSGKVRFVAYRRPHGKASLSLFAAGGLTGGGSDPGSPLRSYSAMANDVVAVIGNGDNLSPMPRRNYEKSSFRHHLPLSVGLSVRKEFAYGLSLESGVNYTWLRSDVRMQYASEDVSQSLHFIGVPLRLNWQFVGRGAFSAYLGAGGMLEKCISAQFGTESVEESALQWSLLAAVGMQYRLAGPVALYFEPEASWYLTETGLHTSRTDAPLTLTLRLGFRFSF